MPARGVSRGLFYLYPFDFFASIKYYVDTTPAGCFLIGNLYAARLRGNYICQNSPTF